ncbi:MAG TPA: hypothetical protein VFF05_03590 [Rudaea sp.]|jgi:hypothetical protein|nr:hypothetical protein [Rudaea sp.]
MKTLARFALVATLTCGAAGAQSGGGYDLHWNAPAAGGATMADAGYTLTGTVAQPAAKAACASGASGYTLRDGFWAGQPGGDVIFRNGFETGC